MRNRFFRMFGSLILILLLVSSSVIGVFAGSLQKNKDTFPNEKPVLKRVAYSEMKGLCQQMPNGTHKGIVVDYLNEIAKYTGWKYEYVEMDSEEMPKALAEKKVDLVSGANYTTDLMDDQACPDYNIGHATITLKARWEDESILNDEVSSLEGKTIGVFVTAVQKREYLEAYFEMHHISVNIREFTKEELVDGSMDYYLKNGEVDVLASKTADDTGEFRTVAYIEAQPYYIVCRKGDTKTLDGLNFALSHINLSNPNFADEANLKNFPHTQNLKFYLTKEEKEYIKKKKTVRVLIPDSLYPLSLTDGKSKPTGITPDLLERVSNLTGLKIEYVDFDASDTSADSVAKLFREKNADIVGCAVANAEVFTGLGLSTSATYISLPRTFIRNKNFDFKNEGMTVAIIKRQRIPSNIKPKKILYFDTLPEVLDAINSGRADLGFSSAANIQYMEQLNFYPNIVTVTAELEDVQYCFATDLKGDFYLLTILNKAINSMTNDEMREIRENHLKLPKRSNLGLIRELLYNNVLKVTSIVIIFICLIAFGLYMYFREKVRREKAALQLEEAQSANRAKSVFLSQMSHDIRTPINGIKGMTHIAIENLDNLEILSDSLEKISSASSQLDTLVNEVLEMSRIESGKMQIIEKPFDLCKLENDINSVISSLAEQSDIVYSYSSAIEHHYLIGSSVYIERVMMNILSNAIKYTPAGGRVKASMEERVFNENEGTFVFTVSDNGIGMSKDFLKDIFEPFAREHRDAGTTYTGTGLGMPITKELVDLMKGTIEITSESNKGTTVVIQLPIKYDLHRLENDDYVENALLGLRILVAEDNELNSEIVSYILKENGAEVQLAENGRVAVDLFEGKPSGYYDVILMDLMMPVMDGYAATKAIRESNKDDSLTIPIIATTANAFIEDLQKCLEYGMNDHVAKPINIDELIPKIRRFII